MVEKRTMTLNLTDAEMRVVEAMCDRKGLSKTALLKQALRLYSMVDARIDKGGRMFIEDPKTAEKAEVLLV